MLVNVQVMTAKQDSCLSGSTIAVCTDCTVDGLLVRRSIVLSAKVMIGQH